MTSKSIHRYRLCSVTLKTVKISVSRIKVVHCCLISEIASLPFSPAIGMNDNFFNVALRQSERVVERSILTKIVVRVNYQSLDEVND